MLSRYRVLMAFFLVVAALTMRSANAALPQTPIVLVVDASDAPSSSIVHVHETIAASVGILDLAYPRWVPGEHGPKGPVQNVAGIRAHALGHSLDIVRDLADTNEFHVTVPAGVTAVDIDFDYLGSGDGTYGESRLATSTILAINWNQFFLYPARADIAQVSIVPTLVLPGADWTAETALPDPSRTGNRITYAAATLERLVDSPLDAGTAVRRFTLLDKNGFTNEIDAFADRSSDLDLPAKKLVGFKAIVGEMDAIYGARHWKNYHFLLTVSDAMPGNGVEHGSSSDDGGPANSLTDSSAIVGTAGLLAHEFNHSWDGKYRRPADLATDNFQVPEETDLLWIYEGMTQFYGDLVPTRAGLWTQAYFRDELASTYAREDAEIGRMTRPLEDTAAAAPFLYDAPRSLGTERRSAGDFYAEGELLWLDVDARLGAMSHGTKSLDGFCKTFFGKSDTPPEVDPYTYAQFIAALSAYQPYDWTAYFKTRVYDITPHPPSAFATLGWKLVYTAVPNLAEERQLRRGHALDSPFALGIEANDKGEVHDAVVGSPAARARLGYGDTIVAVDRREFTPEVFADVVKASRTVTAPIVLIVKRHGLFRTVSIDYHAGLRYPHLVRILGTPDMLAPIVAPHRTQS